MFTRSEVILLTNKQAHKQRDAAETSNVVRYATTLGNNALLALFVLHSLAGAARQLLLGRPT